MTFQMKLAGLPMEVSAIYDSTRQFCQEYLTKEEPVFSVVIQQKDIEDEKEQIAATNQMQKQFLQSCPDSYLETLALYRKIASELLNDSTLLFHGSAVAVDGQGYLFTAASGTGKSTHVRLWREKFQERAVMINDDKPLLHFSDSGILVYGTPWNGKHRLSNNLAVPLKGLCILERSQENKIQAISGRDAWPKLLQQSYRPKEPEKLQKVMALVDKLASEMKLYRLSCNMDPLAAEIAYQGMQE